MGIEIYGTSHVSGESLELIENRIEEHDPDIIAVELDLVRLNSLLDGERHGQGPFFLELIKKFQGYIGSRTGVMPGDEMIHAYRIAMERGNDVYLIDQDIRVTVRRIQEIPRKEKVRAVLESIAGILLPGKFDFDTIPDSEFVEELLEEMKQKYPSLYRVLVEERNQVMAKGLRNIQENNPGAEIVVFVGAAHRKKLERLLEEDG